MNIYSHDITSFILGVELLRELGSWKTVCHCFSYIMSHQPMQQTILHQTRLCWCMGYELIDFFITLHCNMLRFLNCLINPDWTPSLELYATFAATSWLKYRPYPICSLVTRWIKVFLVVGGNSAAILSHKSGKRHWVWPWSKARLLQILWILWLCSADPQLMATSTEPIHTSSPIMLTMLSSSQATNALGCLFNLFIYT